MHKNYPFTLTEFRSEQAIVIHLYREAHKHF
jgi:hypothetical protein